MESNVDRILARYDAATDAERADGANWYPIAHSLAEELADSKRTLYHTAGVIAALSPQVQWPVNARSAAAMVRAARSRKGQPKVSGYPANRAKAWAMARGSAPHSVLGGDKVISFFANILGDHDAVTIDVWAYRAATGKDGNQPDGKRYAALADDYRTAAAARGVVPSTLQAVVWLQVKRTWRGN